MTQLYEYKLDMHTHTNSYREEGTGNYDNSWSDDTSIDIFGVLSLNNKRNDLSQTVVSTQKFERGDKAYMVFIAWGTGDSFGHSSNSDYIAVHLFKDKTLAELLIAQIKYDYITQANKYDYENSFIEYLTDDNSMHKLPTYAWKGYFESIDTLLLSEVIVGQKNACNNIPHSVPYHEEEKKEFQENFLILSDKIKMERFLAPESHRQNVLKI